MYESHDHDKIYGEERKTTPPAYNPWAKEEFRRAPVYAAPAKPKRGFIAIMLAVTVLLSGILGFAGGIISTRLSGDGGPKYPLLPRADSSEDVQMQGEATTVPSITAEQLAAADSSAFNAAAVAAVGLPSVVEITTEVVARNNFIMGNYVSQGAGSGVIISQDGYIVTNHHVIDGASKILVRTRDTKEYSATIVGSDQKTDLAVLKIEATGLTPAQYGSSGSLVIGQRVLAIGNPLGELGGTVTEGIISALDRELQVENEMMTLLQTDASVNPGNSGGGLFDGKGTLVGIVNAKSSGTGVEGLGFAIPIDTARVVIDEIISNGYVTGRAEAGIEVAYIDEQTAYLYRLGSAGVYISAVTRGSAAEKAGLVSGDRVIKVADKEITSVHDVVSAVQSHKAGQTVDFVIEREGKQTTIKVTLDEEKPSIASLF